MQPNLAKSSFGWLPPQLHLKIEEKNPAEMWSICGHKKIIGQYPSIYYFHSMYNFQQLE
jgi:hypothetical protein